jgi:diguanylate cyclase (GGDEF)-like protein
MSAARHESSRTVVRVAAAAACAIAGLTLLGWAADFGPLVRPVSVMPMAPLTACAVLALAVGLWALSAEPVQRRAAHAAGAIAVVAGVAGIADSVLGSGTAVDRLLFGVNARMPLVTGLAMVVLGAAVVLAGRDRSVVGWAAAVAGAIGAGALVGFLLGVPIFVGRTHSVQMSWQSAVCVSLVAVGLAAVHPVQGVARLLGDRGLAGRFARLGLLAAVGMPVGAGTLSMAGARVGWFSYSVAAWVLTLAAVAGLTVVTAVAADRLHRDDLARSEYERQLTELATRDPLTGAYNRRHFATEAERAVARARRYGERAAVAVVDLDFFKEVNDTWGHAAGDEALVRVYRALRARLRSSDVLGRIGGDEFAALITHVDGSTAEHVAADMGNAIATVADELAAEGRPSRLAASVGVAPVDPERPIDAHALIDLADRDMYRNKRLGRTATSGSSGEAARPHRAR